MATVTINDTYLNDIANAIRAKNSSTETFKPKEMAAAIMGIVTDLDYLEDYGYKLESVLTIAKEKRAIERNFFEGTLPNHIYKLTAEPNSLLTTFNSWAFAKNRNLLIVDLSPCTVLKYLGTKMSSTSTSDIHVGYCFSECSGLLDVALPPNLKIIGDGSFYKCSSLKSIHIPDSVEIIGYLAFAGCDALKTVTIPEGVKELGDEYNGQCFAGCRNLETVYFEGTPEHLSPELFYGCDNLHSIYVPWGPGDFVDYRWKTGCNAEIIYYNLM